MNLPDLWHVGRCRQPGKPALVFAEPAREPLSATYAELASRARRLAAGLQARGLGPGDRVGFWLGSHADFVTTLWAVLESGAVVVPINPAYRPRELAHVLNDAEPRFVLTETARRGELEATGNGAAAIGVEDLDAWMAAEETFRPPLVGGDDLALLLYTSGTTGASKGAMLSHNNLLATVTGLLAAWSWRPEDVLLLTLPIFHTHGLIVGLASALAAGATVVLHPRFEAARVLGELERGAATLFFGVPTMYKRLFEELGRREGGIDFSRVRLFASGSAPLPPELFTGFRERTGHDILERYGMTETGMLLSNPYAGPRLPGSVGHPLPGVSVRLDGEGGAEVPLGGEGELWVRGGNVFSGYWRAPEKTAAAFHVDVDGRRWFRTGDLARQDPASGAFCLLGRRHELILRGGFNVYPREIEEVLAHLAGVREVAVVGRPHAEWGEVPVAYLVADRELEAAELEAFCRDQMAGYKVPAAFHRVDELPRNALGKVEKHRLP